MDTEPFLQGGIASIIPMIGSNLIVAFHHVAMPQSAHIPYLILGTLQKRMGV